MMQMILLRLAEYDYIVKVYNYAFSYQVRERLVHQHGKGGRRVCHTKVHDPTLKGALSGTKGGF